MAQTKRDASPVQPLPTHLLTYSLTHCPCGQALIEFVIFGSLLVMLLGVLINYGLNYDFQQQAIMQSFRQALGIASAPLASDLTKPTGSATTILINDRHIPNPANPFAVGSVNPVSSSASVTRNFALQETAHDGDFDALPSITLQVEHMTGGCPGSILSSQGSQPPCKYLTANFRLVPGVSKENLDHYREVYGGSNVCRFAKCGGSGCRIEKNGEEKCDSVLTLNIIDSCDGEIIDYDACIRQARMITDSAFCEQECEDSKPPNSTKDCTKVCSQWISPPWYAVDCQAAGQCPPLDGLFRDIKAMGLQPGYAKRTLTSATLTVTQGTDTASGSLVDETTRTFVTQGGPQSIVTEKVVPTDGTY